MTFYYVYLHKTEDSGMPFYIGKGSKNRAYVSNHRNKHWRSVVKAHGFKVEFLATHLNEIEAYYLESYFIKVYGRRQNGGLLVNQTDGGEGQSGAIPTKEHREKMRNAIKGKLLREVNAEALISDYKQTNNLRQVCSKHGICIATAMKYIPKELRQESRSANGRLNSIRLLGKKPWNHGNKAGKRN